MTVRKYKRLGLYGSILVLSCGLIACTPAEETNQETVSVVEVEEVEKDIQASTVEVKTEKYNETTDAFNIEIEMPILSGLKDENFQFDENKAMSESVMAYAENIKQMALDIKEEGYLTSPYYVGVNYAVLMQNNSYLSIEINYNEYTGGAHGNYYSDYLIYDLEAETRIALKDIVKTDVDYMQVINDAVLEAIEDKRASSEYGDALHSWYEGVEEETLSFSLQADGFGVHFQPYEIGPYAEGAPSFIIPYERLSDIMVLKDF